MSGGIFWLASYPKSGNTWFRIFLTNLKRDSDNPADINALETDGIASSRAMLDDVLGFASSDLLPEEIDALRPAAYRWLHNHAGTQTSYVKVHDALHTADGKLLFDGGASLGAVYILRNPLDVAISAAAHWNVSIDGAIERMGKRTSGLLRRQSSLNRQVRQHLSSWSEHVQGWIQHQRFPICVLRYEDMLHDAEATFGRAAEFLSVKHDAGTLRRAIAFSDFRVLAAQEAEKGFHETLRSEQRFFRRGKATGWLDTLSAAQVARIVADHSAVMRQYGYLDATGNPIVDWQPLRSADAATQLLPA